MALKERGKPTGSHRWMTVLAGPGSISEPARRCDPLALTAEMSNLKRSVGSLLYCHSIASFPGSCIIGNAAKSKTRRKEIRAGKCQVDLLQRWGAGVPGKSSFLPKPPAWLHPPLKTCSACSGISPEAPVCSHAGAVAWPPVARIPEDSFAAFLMNKIPEKVLTF